MFRVITVNTMSELRRAIIQGYSTIYMGGKLGERLEKIRKKHPEKFISSLMFDGKQSFKLTGEATGAISVPVILGIVTLITLVIGSLTFAALTKDYEVEMEYRGYGNEIKWKATKKDKRHGDSYNSGKKGAI